MPTPAVALKLKKFRRRFGITAPRVAVRSDLGWHWYASGLLVLVVLVAVVVWSLARHGEVSELNREIRVLRDQLFERNEELVRLRAGAATEQSAVQMERSTRQQLVSRIRVLEQENASLKEEVSLLQRLAKDCPRKSGAARHN